MYVMMRPVGRIVSSCIQLWPVVGLRASALEGECAPFHALDGPTANNAHGSVG